MRLDPGLILDFDCADHTPNTVSCRTILTGPNVFQICSGLCSNGVNTHFGTEFSSECWCAENPELTINGEQVDSAECDMTCAGATDGELCGGRGRITAFEVRPN